MTQTPLTPKAEATRQTILDTGRELVLRKGFANLGLQEILKVASVPKGSFYHYFPSKEAFGTALLTQYVETYAGRLARLLERPGTGREKLMRYFGAWITDPDDPTLPGWAETCLVVKLAAEVADLSEEMRLVLAGGVERLQALGAVLIAEGQADGSLTKGPDPEALSRVLYQMWLGSALLVKLTRSPLPMQDALRSTEKLLG